MTAEPETCGNCRFCNINATPHRCRRKPPVVLQGQLGVLYQWPVVLSTDWCGDWDDGDEAQS